MVRMDRLFMTGLLLVIAVVIIMVNLRLPLEEEKEKKTKICNRGWECNGPYCCNYTISEIFKVENFEELFSKRNSPVAHAVGFWDYRSFILAAAQFEGIGFCTTGGKTMQMKEIAAFLGHVGSQTNCGDGVITGGPYAWGLCYNHEMSPGKDYCYPDLQFPCSPGAAYYGRGAISMYGNHVYGVIGAGLKLDLLNHPEMVEQNATVAFLTAMWWWMNSLDKKLEPSPHDVFVGNWKPTKNDTISKRLPGFGTTMNILYGGRVCGQGDIDAMNNIISHYQYYLDLMGVGRDASGGNLTCAEQVPFDPSTTSSNS